MLQLGELNGRGLIYPPRWTFYLVAPKPLTIVIKAFVTFPEYVWTKNAEKNNFQISLLMFPIWRLENGHPTGKGSKILY